MAISNEVTSQPAQAAAPAAAPEAKSDGGLKGNVTGAEARQFLAKSFLKQLETETAPKAPVNRSSDIAAAPADKSAASEGANASPANPEAKAPAEAEKQKADQPEPKEDASDVPFNLSHLDPKARETVEAELRKYKESNQQKIQERINKEVAKRKALEDELSMVRAQAPVRSPIDPIPQQQVQHAAQSPIAPVPFPSEVPFSHISDPRALQQEAQTAQKIRDAADDALTAGPTGARIDESGQRIDLYKIDGHDFTKEQVINVRRNARQAVESGIPARLQDLQIRQQNRQQAEANFPWIKNPAAPEFQRAAAVANAYPFLRNLPNAENIIGVMVEGLLAVESRKSSASSGKSAALGKITPTPPSDQVTFSSVGRAASRAQDGTFTKQAVADEMDKLKGKKGVSSRDMRKFLLATDQLRNSR